MSLATLITIVGWSKWLTSSMGLYSVPSFPEKDEVVSRLDELST